MKIREIISESFLSEEPDAIDNANLLQVLLYLKERSEDEAEAATLRTNSVIQLVRNAGQPMFDYRALTQAFEEDEAVKNLIKTFNVDQLTLKSDLDEPDADFTDDQDDHQTSPEDTVQNMASRAQAKR